ncbi:MAG: hypothetical protein QXD23_00770 [Candidatus Micrarchaeaceae archaeon]
MAKSADKNSGNGVLSFILAFLGSLVYLYVVYTLLMGLQSGWTASLVLFGGSGSFFLPLLVGVGVVSSIGLFLASFGLMKNDRNAKFWVNRTSILGGISLIALFAGSTTTPAIVWYAILGFILSMIGSIASEM